MTDPVDTDALRTQALRNQATDIRADATEAEQDWVEVAESLDAAADEVDRLRSVIENAPHDLTKQHAWHGLDMTLCRCWKADAL